MEYESYQYFLKRVLNEANGTAVTMMIPAVEGLAYLGDGWTEIESRELIRVTTDDVINPEHYNSVFGWVGDFAGDEMGYGDEDMIIGVYSYKTYDPLDPHTPLTGLLEIDMETNTVLNSYTEREE